MHETYRFGLFTLNWTERRLHYADEPVTLTPKQFDLLFFFVKNAGRTAKKNEILEAVWAETYIEEATLERNISWLRGKLAEYCDGRSLIETVPKLGYRFATEVTLLSNQETQTQKQEDVLLLVAEDTHRAEETVFVEDAGRPTQELARIEKSGLPSAIPTPSRRRFSSLVAAVIGVVFTLCFGSGYVIYQKNFSSKGENNYRNAAGQMPSKAIETRLSGERGAVKIGSVVHLQNDSTGEPVYLDAWGAVKNKAEFDIVPTEIMFVSTHPHPNRENGSGSWQIESANGKRVGENMLYGDRIHLKSVFPEGGYLDNCGWIKDMPVFKNYKKLQKFAVFTAYSEDRDQGMGTWIVGSDTQLEGTPVLHGEPIALENGFGDGGFLNIGGRIGEIPAFTDYDGAQTVFIHDRVNGRYPPSGVWQMNESVWQAKEVARQLP